MKVIETMYGGYHFRSRLEARWAVFFYALNTKYEYEKEGFDLGDAGAYLPDFWLPEAEMWAEVKPLPFTQKEVEKCNALVEFTGCPCLMLIGIPENKPYTAIIPEGNGKSFRKSEYWVVTHQGFIRHIEEATNYARAHRFGKKQKVNALDISSMRCWYRKDREKREMVLWQEDMCKEFPEVQKSSIKQAREVLAIIAIMRWDLKEKQRRAQVKPDDFSDLKNTEEKIMACIEGIYISDLKYEEKEGFESQGIYVITRQADSEKEEER